MNVDRAVDIYFGVVFAGMALLLGSLGGFCASFFFAYGWDRLPGLLIGVFFLMVAGASGIMSWTLLSEKP